MMLRSFAPCGSALPTAAGTHFARSGKWEELSPADALQISTKHPRCFGSPLASAPAAECTCQGKKLRSETNMRGMHGDDGNTAIIN